MSQSAYGRGPCRFCGKLVSGAAHGRYNHEAGKACRAAQKATGVESEYAKEFD
jgi:hypothetical protein